MGVPRLDAPARLMGVHRRGGAAGPTLPGAGPAELDFHGSATNQRWVADITEFPTGEGKPQVAGLRVKGQLAECAEVPHRSVVPRGRVVLTPVRPGVARCCQGSRILLP